MFSFEDLDDLVSNAYQHLYDFVCLRTHPLTKACFRDDQLTNKERGWCLHNLLLEMVEELNPGPNAPRDSKEWRRHQLMVLRYVDGLEPSQVADRLAISRRQYYRDHAAAIEAVSHIIWDRHQFSLAGADSHTLLQQEIVRISHDEQRANLNLVIDGVLSVLQPALQDRHITLQLAVTDSMPPVKTSHNLLRQVLLGELGCMIEHLEQGSLLIATHMVDNGLCLRIMADPAPELSSPQVQDQIEPLEQMLTRRNADLSVLKSGDRLLGFELKLPTDQQATVLVVDDNEDMLDLYERYLSPNHYHVIRAVTADSAIDLALRLQPTVVILDLMMPDQDGWEVLRSLRVHPDTSHLPVVVCSVLKQKELTLTLGAQAFIEKPITEAELLATLTSLDK